MNSRQPRLEIATFSDEDMDFVPDECYWKDKQATHMVTFTGNNNANAPYYHVCDDHVAYASKNVIEHLKLNRSAAMGEESF